jgi:hypothetical protein
VHKWQILRKDASEGDYSMKYMIAIKHTDDSVSYLTHRGRMVWCIKTARKHLRYYVREHVAKNPKWANVRYFGLSAA